MAERSRLVWKGLDVGGSDLEDSLVVGLVVADDVLPRGRAMTRVEGLGRIWGDP